MSTNLVLAEELLKFNEDQPRDEQGRWAGSRGSFRRVVGSKDPTRITSLSKEASEAVSKGTPGVWTDSFTHKGSGRIEREVLLGRGTRIKILSVSPGRRGVLAQVVAKVVK